MKKQFLFILISCITFQTPAMNLGECPNDKEPTSSQQLLIPINTTTEYENNKITTRDKNNYITFPTPIGENAIRYLPMKFNTNEEEYHDEIYETIPLHDAQNNDVEEDLSSKCLLCCIPLTKEKIAKLTKKNIDIHLYREDKCGKRKLITACVVVPVIVIASSLIGLFTWIATIPDCHNSNSSLSPCWDWIW